MRDIARYLREEAHDVARYTRHLASEMSAGTPGGSRLTWRRLAGSWLLVTFVVAALLAALAAGGLLSSVAVALLWIPAQAAILAGLGYAARAERHSDRVA